ncbi:MAG: tetratricopeptide repeat protein [Spirochaetaceae bacterium]|nr:MAG: tetratricopeptide repeat protein [Spirochaetaceae bacterium]
MPQPGDPLKSIVYITVPPHLERNLGEVHLDPRIPLPVETTAGWSMEELSWEQIIAAMLKILANRVDHEHAAYYRRFVLAARPTIVDDLSETGVLKARNRDFEIADEIFRALCGLLPSDSRPRLNLALLCEQRADAYEALDKPQLAAHQTERAFELYKELLAADSVVPEVYLNAGYFFIKQRNYGRARSAFEAFLEAGSSDAEKCNEVERIIGEIDSQNLLDTLFKEAYDYIRLGRETEAIERIRDFLQKRPDVWNAWFLLGWANRRLENYAEAKEAFLQAVETGSTEPDTLNELAICRMELGELDESRADLERALQRDPENAKIISNMGILSLKEGKPAEAAAFFRTVLEYEPEDPIALNYLEMLEQQ